MKKFMVCLGILVLIIGFGGMARATSYTFNFDQPGLAFNSNATDIGTYMTGIFGSTVTVAGGSPSSEHGGLIGNDYTNDGYLESETGQLITITFSKPITSISFDYGFVTPAKFLGSNDGTFFAAYSANGGSTFSNFLTVGPIHNGNWLTLDNITTTGTENTFTALPINVTVFKFFDSFTNCSGGELGIDNLVVDPISTPEPATLLFLGTGLIGLGFFGRRKFKK
jgi:hypothetical protein